VWTIKTALEWTQNYLAEKGDENPRLSAQWLLSEATGLSRTHLFMSFDQPLSEEERATLRNYVAKRGAGEPLQYITGEAPFRHITLKVRPGVLIPRPETEVLVSEVLAHLPAPKRAEAQWNAEAAAAETEAVAAVKEALKQAELDAHARGVYEGEKAASEVEVTHAETTFGDAASNDVFAKVEAAEATTSEAATPGDVTAEPTTAEPTTAGGATPQSSNSLLIADICTGSGCIACSLAYEHPQVKVIATDISPDAVALAKENVAALQLEDRVAVLECNLGSGIGTKRLGTFDAVVSNPPYIPTDVMEQLPAEVAAHEPHLALAGGTDGLDIFRPLAAWAYEACKPGGLFACELHEGHLDQAANLARAQGFSQVRVVNDLASRPRVLLAVK
jgi:release factor glutamine methyltransferase